MNTALYAIREDLLKLTELHRHVVHRMHSTQPPTRAMLAEATAAIERRVPGFRVYYLYHEDVYVLLPV